MRDRAGQPINITQWAMFYSFDVIGEIAFENDFGNLVTGTKHSAIKPIHEHIKVLESWVTCVSTIILFLLFPVCHVGERSKMHQFRDP